jgi:hypothetical protein
MDLGPEASQIDDVDGTCHCCWRVFGVASDIQRFPAVCEISIIDVEWQLGKMSVESGLLKSESQRDYLDLSIPRCLLHGRK